MSTFGTKVQVAGLLVAGEISRLHDESIPATIKLAEDIVEAIGMNCSHPAQVADYPPNADGVSPGFIVTQPIYESAVMIDVWPPLQLMYVHVVSCKDFTVEPVWKVLQKAGFTVKDAFGNTLATTGRAYAARGKYEHYVPTKLRHESG